MKLMRLALVGATVFTLVACNNAKQENTPVPEEMPANNTPAPAPPPTPADTVKAEPAPEPKETMTKKPAKKPASNTTNVQKKENRDVPTTAEPTNVQKRPSRE